VIKDILSFQILDYLRNPSVALSANSFNLNHHKL